MWFMNKVANPLVCFILHSPLHGLMDKSLLVLTYSGRKSGKSYSLPVQYARCGSEFIIVPGAPEKKTWWRNLKNSAEVILWVEGKRISARAAIIDCEAESDQAAEALHAFLMKFPTAAPMFSLEKRGSGDYEPEQLRRAARAIVIAIARQQ